MESLSLTEQRFQRREQPVPPLDSGEMESGEPVEILLRFAPQLAFRVWDEFDGTQVQTQADGSLVTTLRCPPGPWIVSYLFSYGAGVEVLSPPQVQKALLEEAKQVAQLYGNSF